MEVILSEQCKSLTGCLGKGYGYFIQKRKAKDGSVRFFSQRSKHLPIPRDGHLRFILTCADLAQTKLHVSDIRVKRGELADALWEAGLRNLADSVTLNTDHLPNVMNAADFINKFINKFINNNNL